jgi:hypothetical protein
MSKKIYRIEGKPKCLESSPVTVSDGIVPVQARLFSNVAFMVDTDTKKSKLHKHTQSVRSVETPNPLPLASAHIRHRRVAVYFRTDIKQTRWK